MGHIESQDKLPRSAWHFDLCMWTLKSHHLAADGVVVTLAVVVVVVRKSHSHATLKMCVHHQNNTRNPIITLTPTNDDHSRPPPLLPHMV